MMRMKNGGDVPMDYAFTKIGFAMELYIVMIIPMNQQPHVEKTMWWQKVWIFSKIISKNYYQLSYQKIIRVASLKIE